MHEMDVSALAQTDLNLLVVLAALMQERSVTRAARRLSLSQPAVSHALRRLRDLFGDELLVRSGHKMVPTSAATAILERLRPALEHITEALGGPAELAPETATGAFRVSAFDFAQLALVPPLALELGARAPGLQLIAQPYRADAERALAEGEVDLVIGLAREPPHPHQRTLLVERFTCVVRRGHPCLARNLTARRYAALSHVLVSPVGRPRGYLDAALAELGLERQILLTTPQLVSAALAVAGSDLILTTSVHLAELVAKMLPLAIVEPQLPMSFTVAMSWHARREHDTLHRWLRDRVVEVADRLR